MHVDRSTRIHLRSRVQVALPNRQVLSGHTLDVAVGGICIILQDQIPVGMVYPIRFEMLLKGKTHVITTEAKSIYGVFASGGGFRVGLAFTHVDAHRTELIESLAGKRLSADTTGRASEPSPVT